MWLQEVLYLGALLALSTTTESPACLPKACSKDPDSEKAVCGSDGLSYPNRCHLEMVRCVSKNITLVKRGPCRRQRLCRDWEVYRHTNPQYSFEAICRPDGSYAARQCYPDTGFCWCVTPEGLPLPYTSQRLRPGSRAHCSGRKTKKSSTRRRSPGGRRDGREQKRRSCRQPDKAKFNNNLINIFHTEWGRVHGAPSRPHTNDTDSQVIKWKFTTLDMDGNGVLDQGEYRDLRKVARKAVKPKRCSRNFPKTCDLDGDALVSLQEWTDCLTRDGVDDGGDARADPADDDRQDSVDVDEDPPLHPTLLNPNGLALSKPEPSLEDESSSEIRDEDPSDCLSARQAALRDEEQIYVPECTPDGRYKKIQCYKSAGYCFCVHEDTGKNIPGTSVKHGDPKCDHLTSINRPMKGCPDDKKTVFLRDLLQFLHLRMSEIINGTKNLNLPWIPSREEQAATWSFVVFDKNKNKMLERNEWKAFKEMVSNVKSLKKCGKKLPRYCDINKDRHISMTEWLDCLDVQQVTPTINPASSRAGKRNPLHVLLED